MGLFSAVRKAPNLVHYRDFLSEACVRVGAMSGGSYGRRGRGIGLGERAGIPEPQSARPWENAPPAPLVQPRDRHVEVMINDEWHQGLAVALRRDPAGSWRVLVAYVLAPGVVHEEWVEQHQVRLRENG